MIVLLLAGCATAPPPKWVRLDGKMITGSDALETQFEVDVKICEGEMQKAGLSATAEAGFGRGRAINQVFVGCMAKQGYVQRQIP